MTAGSAFSIKWRAMAMPELRIEHLSKSSAELFQTCARAWRARYIDGIKSPSTPALAVGTAFDRVTEAEWRSPGGVDLQDRWRSTWAEVSTDTRINWNGDTPQQFETQGARLLALPETVETIRSITPLRKPSGEPYLQYPVTLRIPDVAVPVIGYVDLIESDGTPGDVKTAGRAWEDGKAAKELQPKLYLAALLAEGFPLRDLRFRHYVFVKPGARSPGRVQVIETEYTPGQITHAIETVREVWRAVTAGVFVPNPNAFFCKPGDCAVWDVCMGAR